MKKILSILFNHERYQTIAIIVAFLFLGIFYGCQPMCKSILKPNVKISRMELEAEINSVIDKANIAYASLDQQEELRSLLFETSLLAATTQGINPIPLITSIAAVLGVGAVTDNVRKRKQIKKLTK